MAKLQGPSIAGARLIDREPGGCREPVALIRWSSEERTPRISVGNVGLRRVEAGDARRGSTRTAA